MYILFISTRKKKTWRRLGGGEVLLLLILGLGTPSHLI
jgi:hypothetical protein